MDNTEELISIVIPNWNGEKIIDFCLQSLFSQKYLNFEVIVVDNNSSDNSVLLIERKYPKVQVIKLKSNTGFSFAVNVGIKKSRGTFVVLLNNDTEVSKNWLSSLIRTFLQDEKIGIVTSKLINYYEREVVDGAGDEMNIVGQAHSRGFGEDIRKWDMPGYVFLATGGASVYKKEVFDKIGYFEETYYMYFEDADLSYRAQKQGIKIFYQPNAIVYHMHRASSNKRKNFLEYLLYRNFTIFYLINTPFKLFFTRYSILKFVLVFFHTAYFLSASGYIMEVARVWMWLILNCRKILSLRRTRNVPLKVSLDYVDSYRKDKKLKILGRTF